MSVKLPKDLLDQLRPLEKRLEAAVRAGASDEAARLAAKIQKLMGPTRRTHHRLLRAKLWAFETALESNRLSYADSGFSGVRSLASRGTRLHLEATALLAITRLRQAREADARSLIVEVYKGINSISSDARRRQFQERFLGRLEEEVVLKKLVGGSSEQLNVDEIHNEAVNLLQGKSEEEILELIGSTVPLSGLQALQEMRSFSLNQLPVPDRKLLPSSDFGEEPRTIGKRVFSFFGRVLWKTFCQEDSPIFKLWSARVPKVFNEGYFASAVVTTLSEFRIGIPILASGIVALVMKYSAQELCSSTRPQGMMISRSEKAT